MTQLYGPAVRCKLNLQNGGWSCASVSGPCVEQSLLAIMDIRARPISFSDRPSKASWVTRSRTRRRDRSPILQIQLADLGGYLPFQMCSRIDGSHPFGATVARPDRRATVAEKGGGHPFGEPASSYRCCAETRLV